MAITGNNCTPSVKKSGFGLSHGNLFCVHIIIADPDLARICVHTTVAGFYGPICKYCSGMVADAVCRAIWPKIYKASHRVAKDDDVPHRAAVIDRAPQVGVVIDVGPANWTVLQQDRTGHAALSLAGHAALLVFYSNIFYISPPTPLPPAPDLHNGPNIVDAMYTQLPKVWLLFLAACPTNALCGSRNTSIHLTHSTKEHKSTAHTHIHTLGHPVSTYHSVSRPSDRKYRLNCGTF